MSWWLMIKGITIANLKGEVREYLALLGYVMKGQPHSFAGHVVDRKVS